MNWTLLTVLLTSAIALAPNANADGFPKPTLVNVPLEHVFMPSGFDDNDNAQIVIHGEFPSTCYKAAKPQVRVDRKSHTIAISARAYVYTGCFCAEVMVPFSQTIDLGVLGDGEQRIVELDDKGKLRKERFMNISRSMSSAPDDFLYAPVKQVIVDRTVSPAGLILTGTFPNDCMTLGKVKVLTRKKDIIEVLPIADYAENRKCKAVSRPFVHRIRLKSEPTGDVLIHVRALNGQSLNQVERF
jgi:hypothetical protein